jgi:hypothetical protein
LKYFKESFAGSSTAGCVGAGGGGVCVLLSTVFGCTGSLGCAVGFFFGCSKRTFNDLFILLINITI